MPATLCIKVKTDETQAVLQQLYKQGSDPKRNKDAALALSGYFRDLASGFTRGKIDVQTGSAAPVRASGTFTFTSVIATDAFTIAGVTFTFTSTPTLETDVEVDGSGNDLDAQAALAAINAHSTISKIVVATRAANVVTVTALEAGVVGNFIAISDADTTIATSGAYLTGGTGGADDAVVSFELGLS